MLRNRRIRISLLVAVMIAAGLAWWLDRQPSSAAEDARMAGGTGSSMTVPRTALQEHMQQARSFARQLLPRAGATRYPDAEDYLWIEVKDCQPHIRALRDFMQSQYEPKRSLEDALAQARLSRLTRTGWPDAVLSARDLWPDDLALARLAANDCRGTCPRAMQLARDLAQRDGDNLPSWLPLLSQSRFENNPALFRHALEGAATAPRYDAWLAPEATQLRPLLQIATAAPEVCALEFERRGLLLGHPYTTSVWHDETLLAMVNNPDTRPEQHWMQWCLPDVGPVLSQRDLQHCRTVMRRIVDTEILPGERHAPLRTTLWLNHLTRDPEQVEWMRRVRREAWLNEHGFGTIIEAFRDRGWVAPEGYVRLLDLPNRQAYDAIVAAWERRMPIPAEFDPLHWWWGSANLQQRRLSMGPDDAAWPRVAASMRESLQRKRQPPPRRGGQNAGTSQ